LGWPDYIILGLVGLSVVVGFWRGFIQEVFALAIWLAAFLAAWIFSDPLAEVIGESISLPSARTAVAFAAVFIAVLIVGGLLNYLVGKLVASTGLSGTDRMFGAVFGGVRGVALVVVLILLAGFTPLPNDPWWQESRTIQSLVPLADWVAGLLPESLRGYLDFLPAAAAEAQAT